MLKKAGMLIIVAIAAVSMCGCLALLAGTAGGAGTAAWLSGKLTQEVNASFDKTLNAAKEGLRSLNLSVEKETVKDDIAQVMSNYTDGKTIWIDIHRVSDVSSRIEIRVGATGDKAAADKILKRISRYL
jgi:hypothetical protein